MTDNPNIRGPEDPTKINVNQAWEVETWTKKWNVTEKELKDAVKKVGPLVRNVAKELGKTP